MTPELRAAVERVYSMTVCGLYRDHDDISNFLRRLADEPEVVGHLVQASKHTEVYVEDVRDILKTLAEIVR